MQEAAVFNSMVAKAKTIKSYDISLNLIPQKIKTIFTRYGSIQNVRMNTISMWQSANIEFTNQEDHDKLVHRWSIPFKADLIRIFPFLGTNKYKKERDQHILKLINLPLAQQNMI